MPDYFINTLDFIERKSYFKSMLKDIASKICRDNGELPVYSPSA